MMLGCICVCMLDSPGNLYLIPAAVMVFSFYMAWLNVNRLDQIHHSRKLRLKYEEEMRENEHKRDNTTRT